MGMQCTFGYTDLTDQTQFEIRSLHEVNSNTWSVEVWSKPTEDFEVPELLQSFGLYAPEDRMAQNQYCWFDIGSASEEAMDSIKFLIRNRIPFNCG